MNTLYVEPLRRSRGLDRLMVVPLEISLISSVLLLYNTSMYICWKDLLSLVPLVLVPEKRMVNDRILSSNAVSHRINNEG